MSAYQPIDATPIKSAADTKAAMKRVEALFESSLTALSHFDRFTPDDAADWLAEDESTVEAWCAAQLTIAKLNYPATRRFWMLATLGALYLRSQGKSVVK